MVLQSQQYRAIESQDMVVINIWSRLILMLLIFATTTVCSLHSSISNATWIETDGTEPVDGLCSAMDLHPAPCPAPTTTLRSRRIRTPMLLVSESARSHFEDSHLHRVSVRAQRSQDIQHPMQDPMQYFGPFGGRLCRHCVWAVGSRPKSNTRAKRTRK